MMTLSTLPLQFLEYLHFIQPSSNKDQFPERKWMPKPNIPLLKILRNISGRNNCIPNLVFMQNVLHDSGKIK